MSQTVWAQDDNFTILGNAAYTFVQKHRARIELARRQAQQDPLLYGRALVFESDGTLRAAQSSETLAQTYMTPDRILVLV